MTELTDNQIQEIAQSYFRALLEESNELVWCIERDESLDPAIEAKDARQMSKKFKDMDRQGIVSESIKAEVDEMLAKHGINGLGRKDEVFGILCNAFVRAKVENYRITAAKLLKNRSAEMPMDALFRGIISTKMPEISIGEQTAATGNTLKALSDKFIETNKVNWQRKTIYDKLRSMGLMLDIMGGNRLIHTIKADDIANLVDVLVKLPKNAQQKYKDKNLVELLAIAAETGETLNAKTAQKYLTMIKSFFGWCVDREYIDKIPGQKIDIQIKEKEKARFPFSTEQLENLFTSPLYTGCLSPIKRYKLGSLVLKDSQYWAPLVAIYSGMRIGEITQLLSVDVKVEHEMPYFDLSEVAEDTKQLKTKYSHRRVPVHPFLIETGFLSFVEQQKAKDRLLFSHIVIEEKQPGTKYGKMFGRYIRYIEVKTKKTTFHSLRHNFADALDFIGAPEAHKHAMMGHSGGGVSAHYGQTLPIPVLMESLQKISYPFEDTFRETLGKT
jgi:integrase